MENDIGITCRRLYEEDITYINMLQTVRGYNGIKDITASDRDWAFYGAFDEDKIIGISGLFGYRRLPHDDYPFGYIVESGGTYIVPEYRRRGIGKKLLKMAVDNVKNDFPLCDAIVADVTDANYNIAKGLGFKDSEEHRMWKPLTDSGKC